MSVVGVLPALAIIGGALCAPVFGATVAWLLWLLPVLILASVIAWRYEVGHVTIACIMVGFFSASAVLTTSALDRALHPSLRQELDREVGGFDISSSGPENDHDPILARARLIEDASVRDGYVSLRVNVTALRLDNVWRQPCV